VTTLTETFDTADSDTLGPVNTWVEDVGDIDIVSNKARLITAGAAVARISTNLSSDNHYSQAVLRWDLVSGHASHGIIVRKAGSATQTYYMADIASSSDVARLFRCVAAAFTSLSADVGFVVSAATDYVLQLRCVGSNISALVDTVQKFSVTDTNIVGNLQVGLRSDREATGFNLDWNNFEAADIESVSHRATIAGSGNTTTSLTLVIPASTVANDIVVASFTNGGATADPTVADDEGAGTWVKILSGNNGASNLSVWWKRASGSTAGKTITGSVFTNSCTGGASVYSGCKLTGDPFGGATYESNISGNETHAAITPTINGSMVCLTVGQAPDLAIATQAATSPAVLIERFDHLSTGGADSACAHASEVQVTAESTGNLTWAQTNAATMSIAWYMIPEVAVVGGSRTTFNTRGFPLGMEVGMGWRMDLQ
jgi:hypothetical protein